MPQSYPPLPSFYVSFSDTKGSELLSPERIAELEAEINRRFSHPRDNNGAIIESHCLADLTPYGRYIYPFMPHEEVPFTYAKNQILAAILTDAERKLLSDHAFGIMCDKREEQRFTAAQKVLEKDWDKGVYCGDQYYSSVDDMHESLCDTPTEDYPLYVWAAKPQQVIQNLSAETVLESTLDAHGWEGMDLGELEGVPELEAALAAFTEANEAVVSYEANTRIAIVLDPRPSTS